MASKLDVYMDMPYYLPRRVVVENFANFQQSILLPLLLFLFFYALLSPAKQGWGIPIMFLSQSVSTINPFLTWTFMKKNRPWKHELSTILQTTSHHSPPGTSYQPHQLLEKGWHQAPTSQTQTGAKQVLCWSCVAANATRGIW